MAENSLPAELRSLLLRFAQGDNLEIVELMTGAGLPVQDYAVDLDKPFDINVDSLLAGLLDRHSDQLALAREILGRFEGATLPLRYRLEIRYGSVPIVALRGLLFTFALLGLLAAIFGVHLWIREKRTPIPQGVLRGNLVRSAGYYYVKPFSDLPEGQQEVILLPPRREGLRLFDICHLVVVLNPKAEILQDEAAYRILDLYLDNDVCRTPLEEFLRQGWGVSVDPTKYPSTYLRRAKQENEEAERSGVSQDQRERSYRIARGYYDKAVQIYEENSAFREQSPSIIDRQIENLKATISYQDLLINSVSSKPMHEMVFIQGGNSWRWHEERAQRQAEMIRLPPFWIDRFEVSNHQYEELDSDHPRAISTGEDNYPVTLVSWDQAQRYCMQRGLRLPTEEEFEKAASWDPRRGEPRRYPRCNKSCTDDRLPYGKVGPVQHDPNGPSALNVLNLIGNASEWVIRKASGTGIVKGGSFGTQDPKEFDPRHAVRLEEPGREDIGFRCAADPNRLPSDGVLFRKR